MIKTVGLGKRRADLSHDECVQYHINHHAPFGKRAAGPRGMTKYVGYYPKAAYDLDGKPLAEVPWDFIVPEWFTEDFFNSINEWRANDPEGIEITLDEARFCDRASGAMMTCVENVIVKPKHGADSVQVMFGGKRKAGMSPQEAATYHRKYHAPKAAKLFGDALEDYTAYYIHQAYNLEEGLMAEAPFDIVIQACIKRDFWEGMWGNPDSAAVALMREEENFMDRESTVAMVCDYRPYII
jgi:hypothetical protein